MSNFTVRAALIAAIVVDAYTLGYICL